jgi:rhodanese-related sulfurtransferase
MLSTAGFENVFVLRGGMEAWKAACNPLERV